MKEQLILLLQLQQIDAKVKEIEAVMKSVPSRLEPARRDLAKLEAMLGDEKARLSETETFRKQQQDLMEREQDAFRSAKSKLQGSKTGKEFSAATREVENKRKSISDREGELKKLGETFNQTQSQFQAHEKDVEQVRSQMVAEEGEIATRLAALKAEAETAAHGRDDIRKQIQPSWLKTYDSLAAKKGYAVSPVLKGTCQGCHMHLPPQLNNVLARLQSLELCPRCGRIIYRKELIEGVEGPEAKQS